MKKQFKYPDNIYRKFSIIEKEIGGIMHYALEEEVTYLKFFKRKHIRPVYAYWGSSYCMGGSVCWHDEKQDIESAIHNEHQRDRDLYKYKVTK